MNSTVKFSLFVGMCAVLFVQTLVSGAIHGCKSDNDCSDDECCVPEALTSSESAYKRGGVSSFWRRSMGMGSSALGEWARGLPGTCVSRRRPGQSCGGVASCPCSSGSSCHFKGCSQRLADKHSSTNTGYCIFL